MGSTSIGCDNRNYHDQWALGLDTLPDGKAMVREFKAGDVIWSDAQTHIGENIGESPTHVLMIEMK